MTGADDLLAAAFGRLSPLTVEAILAAAEANPEPTLAVVLAAADRQLARREPVAAYFGFVHRTDVMRRSLPDWINLYGRYPARGLIDLSDGETCAALALCRAGRSDRDRTAPLVTRGRWARWRRG